MKVPRAEIWQVKRISTNGMEEESKGRIKVGVGTGAEVRGSLAGPGRKASRPGHRVREEKAGWWGRQWPDHVWGFVSYLIAARSSWRVVVCFSVLQSWVNFCRSKIHLKVMVKSWIMFPKNSLQINSFQFKSKPVPQNVILFGTRAIADVISN